MQNLTILG